MPHQKGRGGSQGQRNKRRGEDRGGGTEGRGDRGRREAWGDDKLFRVSHHGDLRRYKAGTTHRISLERQRPPALACRCLFIRCHFAPPGWGGLYLGKLLFTGAAACSHCAYASGGLYGLAPWQPWSHQPGPKNRGGRPV